MNPSSNLKYIILSAITLNKIQNTENQEKIFIFDIDDTLYKRNKSFQQDDTKLWTDKYNKLRDNDPSMPKLSKNLINLQLKDESLYSFRKRVSYEVEEEKDESFYTKYLGEDQVLKKILDSVPYKKWCFTNAPRKRAEIILNILGIADCFEGVFYPFYNESIGKPLDKSYEFVERYLNITDPTKIYFFDDLIENIEAANRRRWNGIHVKEDDDIKDIVSKFLLSD